MTVPELESYEKYLRDPASLTDVDVRQLATIDQDLALRAAARRAGYEKPAVAGWVTNREFLDFYQDHFVAQVSLLLNRVKALETRLAAVEREEKTAGVRWEGPYDFGRVYAEGALVTKAGSVWLAQQRNPVGRPGEGVSGWVLICKRGDYGR